MNLWNDRNFKPMLLKEINKPFNSKDHIFELKYDGIRALIFASPKKVEIQSRNMQDITLLFPELQGIKKIVKKPTIFDGEIVAFENNKPSFSNLQKRMHLKNKTIIAKEENNNPVILVAFDILYENKDLTNLSLLQRKDYLNKYPDNNVFFKTKMTKEKGISLFSKVKKLGLEGIVAKNINSKYHINKRTDDFIKIKNIQRDEFIIGGYEEKKDGILSLALGEFLGKEFHYVGNVSIRPKVSIYEKVKKMKNANNPFCDFTKNIFFIKPVIKCHVSYLEKTANGHLRHPIFKDYT